MPSWKAVVTDLDNTLYSWVDYIVPCLEAMVASLEATTGQPRIQIVQSLKAVYEKHETNEYAFAIQESDIFKPYERDFDSFDKLVVDPARRAFRQARERWLRPYPEVVETLTELRRRGLSVIALTDAPRNAAELRLKWLDLDAQFDAVYTLPGYVLPRNVDPEIRRRHEAGHYFSKKTRVIELPRSAEKPNPTGLRRILRDFQLRPSEVLYVGDSVKKDMGVAQACGVLGAWAEYGTYVSREYRERLDIISAKTVTRRHVSEDSPARWPLAISSFAQVPQILDGARWTVPGSTASSSRRPGRAGPRGKRS